MNILELHQDNKAVSNKSLFKTETTTANSIQILAGEELKKHVSKVPGLLLCVTGEAIFENENGLKATLKTGDYVNIEPEVHHWISAKLTSSLVLIK